MQSISTIAEMCVLLHLTLRAARMQIWREKTKADVTCYKSNRQNYRASGGELSLHLLSAHSDDPCRRHYHRSMCTESAGLFYVLKHEAGHLIVVLQSIHRAINFIAFAMFLLLHKLSQEIHLPPVYTKSNWWPRYLYCGKTSAGIPMERRNHFFWLYTTMQYNILHILQYKYNTTMLIMKTNEHLSASKPLQTFPHCLHFPSCRLLWTQWCLTVHGWKTQTCKS